jgi:hypothetical protein
VAINKINKKTNDNNCGRLASNVTQMFFPTLLPQQIFLYLSVDFHKPKFTVKNLNNKFEFLFL